MKSKIPPSITNRALRLIAIPLAIVALSASSQAQLAWNPLLSGSGPSDGNGTWDTTTANWWNGTSNVAYTTSVVNIGNGTAGTYVIDLDANVSFTSPLTFNTSGYTISANEARTISSSTAFAITANTGVTATIGSNVTISNSAGTNPAIRLTGNGTIVLDAGSVVRTTNTTLSQFAIGTSSTTAGASRATTVRVLTGASIESARILRLETGTLSVEGGTVTASTTAASNDGFNLGNQQNFSAENPAAILTIDSGTFTATSTNVTTPRDGIRIAANTTQNGGIINLNGGSLVTSNINSLAGASGNARGVINFDGGILKVASSAVASQRTAFITGFSGVNANKSLLVQDGGAKLDTNGFTDVEIDSALLSGTAGDGGLTLNDTALTAGTLILNATNTYNGVTRANRGKIALGATGSIASSSSIELGVEGGFDTSLQASSFSLLATTRFDLNSTTAGLLNTGSNALVYNGVLQLNFTSGTLASSYNLFDFGSQSGSFTNFSLSGSGFSGTYGTSTFSNNGYDFTFNSATGILSTSVVPEPAIGGLVMMGLASLLLRRSRKSA